MMLPHSEPADKQQQSNLDHTYILATRNFCPHPPPQSHTQYLYGMIFCFQILFGYIKRFFPFFVFPLIILLAFIYSCVYLDTCHTFLLFADFLRIGKITVPSIFDFFLSLPKHIFIKKRVYFSIRILDHTYMEICVGRNSLVHKIKAANFQYPVRRLNRQVLSVGLSVLIFLIF